MSKLVALVTGSINTETDTVSISDINKVIKDSIYNKLDKDYELVTLLPINYKIDDDKIVERPVGKSAK